MSWEKFDAERNKGGDAQPVHTEFRSQLKALNFKSSGPNKYGSEEFKHPSGVTVSARYSPHIPAFGSYKEEPPLVQIRLGHATNDNFKGYREKMPELSNPGKIAAAVQKHIAPYVTKKSGQDHALLHGGMRRGGSLGR